MKTILHKAATRGHADHGWLNSWHTFSFGGYHNPERYNFGALRVLNDDTVAPGMGFGKHPHDNMEIISIPLEGNLEHQDSTGTKQVIKQGDIQIMSAGTGILHSEKNESATDLVKFLQIWVIPNKKNIAPRYDQKTFSDSEKHNQLLTIISPDGESDGIHINQNAWFSLGKLDKEISVDYNLKKSGNGVYVFVLNGTLTVNETELNTRDGLGITEAASFKITATTEAEVLLMEVPMN